MWDNYYTVTSIEEALNLLETERGHAKIIAGGTDLILELKKKLHPGVRSLIDITRIKDQDFIIEEGEYIHIGPLVTHNQCLVSEVLIKFALPLVKAAQSIGSAQIRNVGTVFGNLITASPANDTISPLMAMDAELRVRSQTTTKWVNIHDFYTGVRKSILNDNELIDTIRFKKMSPTCRGTFVKKILREIHGISIANAVALLDFDGNEIKKAVITLGAVAPTIIHAHDSEKYLVGKSLNNDSIKIASELAQQSSFPISDIRGSKKYREHLVKLLLQDALREIMNDSWKECNHNPVLLWGNKTEPKIFLSESTIHNESTPIKTYINEKEFIFTHGQTQSLAKLIREQAKLTGTKLGCEEGECGSCTIYLDGLPVLSCLLPAPKAQDARITTIEGIASGGELHPVQQAFIEEGAVQCGYCTPGFIMSSVKLLEEKPNPNKKEIMEGLAGNVCRCTGYQSIIAAVERAAKTMNG